MTVRILVVADDLLTRAGLAALLSEQADLLVTGQMTTELDPSSFTVFSPDVIVWDLGWDPDLEDEMDRLQSALETGVPIIVLLPEDVPNERVWSSGVQGILRREIDPATLAAAAQAVTHGLTVLDSAPDPTPFRDTDPAKETMIEELTGRELEVLSLLAEGLTNRAIAQQLEISEHTVKFHVNAILSKLNAQSRTEAAVRATRMGFDLL